MIVHDLDIVDAVFPPPKADPPLVVDPDAVLALPVPPKGLEAIAWRHLQVLKDPGPVEVEELASGGTLDCPKPRNDFVMEQRLGIRVLEGPDHQPELSTHYVMRQRKGGRRLGTRYTMVGPVYSECLGTRGIESVVPESGTSRPWTA